ncbi:MAG: hypothetical protein HYV06_08005 [Deltaproteobacteria bacterium]|nr:hypothetical protein [Deltaproteobacteria bacterium]
MRTITRSILLLFLLFTPQAFAADITTLADCATKVFKEINRTRNWSGKAPAGCPAGIAVERRPAGLFVIAWSTEKADGGWVRTSFSAAAGYAEMATKQGVAAANRDILSRAGRIGRCLNSINTVNDPLDCRDRATTSHLVGEKSGSENRRLVWLDDNGRHSVVEQTFGTTSATPAPPAELFGGQLLPPGLIIDLRLDPRK